MVLLISYQSSLAESLEDLTKLAAEDPENKRLAEEIELKTKLIADVNKSLGSKVVPYRWPSLTANRNADNVQIAEGDTTNATATAAGGGGDDDEELQDGLLIPPPRVQGLLKRRVVKYLERDNEQSMTSGIVARAVKRRGPWHFYVQWDHGPQNLIQVESVVGLVSRTAANNGILRYRSIVLRAKYRVVELILTIPSRYTEFLQQGLESLRGQLPNLSADERTAAEFEIATKQNILNRIAAEAAGNFNYITCATIFFLIRVC